MLNVSNLRVDVGDKTILDGIDLKVSKGELVAVLGPNGSGKSTLARAIMGDPNISVKGTIDFMGTNIVSLPPEERSKLGIFLSFQSPPSLDSINSRYFLSLLYNNWEDYVGTLGLKDSLLSKDLFVGFSGGEKKKIELLQILAKRPNLTMLDEIDSGLDVDSIKLVDSIIDDLVNENKSVMVITHYSRIFQTIMPSKVYVVLNGKVVEEGGSEIIEKIEKRGFKPWKD